MGGNYINQAPNPGKDIRRLSIESGCIAFISSRDICYDKTVKVCALNVRQHDNKTFIHRLRKEANILLYRMTGSKVSA